jgi:glutathione synthase/RimK-type ligase-like ATP-grasp enzyme
MIKIALCGGIVASEWTNRMADSLVSEKEYFKQEISWDKVDINCDGWIKKLKGYDAILWPPGCMGIKPASHLKEKVFFIQYHLKKLIVPNFESTWHFESKVAQSYLFDFHEIPTPRTVVTFSIKDAMELLKSEKYPLVFKSSSDAASRGVKLMKSVKQAKYQAWKNLYTGFWWKAVRRVFRLDHRDNVAYWQEFIPKNNCDLRITAIGDKWAVGFWRWNRPNDFRASGSGRIDYKKPIPEETIHFCLDLNKKYNFDSMAYDIIFKDKKPVVVEMCYTYVDKAIHDAPGHYVRDEKGELLYKTGNTWPEQLWVRWFAERVNRIVKSGV